MVPPNVIDAKNIIPTEKFKVLMSCKTKFFPTIYTCTGVEEKGCHTNVHCTFETKQAGKTYTEHTLFGGETKVKIV